MNNFQAGSGQQGRDFELACKNVLRLKGWTLGGKKSFPTGVEVDQIATSPLGLIVLFEFKGGRNRRTCCVKKAVANGALLTRVPIPYWVVMAELPTKGRAKQMIDEALDLGIVSRFMSYNDLMVEEDGKTY